MKENHIEHTSDMHSAVSLQSEQSFVDDFEFDLTLPERLAFLDPLSRNFYWSWCRNGAAVFRELDPRGWEECEQNPRELLKSTSELVLRRKASESEYVEKLESIKRGFETYLQRRKLEIGRITGSRPVAYFCAEFGVHNSLPIYSGGLGILAGDHLKSASDLNLPLVAVGLLYRYGYFRQTVAHDGWQEESYQDSFARKLALEPVFDTAGERITVMITMRGRKVFARAWRALVGGIPLYLLDTNVETNDPVDRLVTGHLYGGDRETRLVQEKVLGIGGVQLLRKLGINPSVFHLNEGHSAFLNLELARELLEKDVDLTFTDVVETVREQCIFTTHTPVDAGNDSFSPELIEGCFDDDFIEQLRLEKQELYALGRIDPDDDGEWFGMTPLAIRLSRSSNGVSKKHGEVSRRLWLKMFPAGISEEDVPISSVTNGVHPRTWIASSIADLYSETIGDRWWELLNDPGNWRTAVESIPGGMLWETHLRLKRLLIAFVRERTFRKDSGLRSTIHEHEDTSRLLDARSLTIGFARRIAGYKRWNLIFSDLERLLAMVDSESAPVQFVFAGKAHPQDQKAKDILQRLMSINSESKWQRRAAFVEDYDQEVARYLVQGVDVWLNVPRRPFEASGTSGQKAAMNGVLNCSVLDGWWIEGYGDGNGFAVGADTDPEGDKDETDRADADSIYEVLENEIIPAYYDLDEDGLPSAWLRLMRNSLASLTPAFSSDRMLRDYIDGIYR